MDFEMLLVVRERKLGGWERGIYIGKGGRGQ